MDKPLLSKRIVVTRPQAQAAGFCQKLADAGAIPIRFPTIRITPMPDMRRLDAALERLSDYAWIVFTSVNGVASCWDRLAAVASTRLPASLRVAAGPSQAPKRCWRMDKPLLSKRIVVTRPQAQAAGFCQKLADAGAIPIRFPTIRITPMPDMRRLDAALERLSDYAWIVFTSEVISASISMRPSS